MNFFFHLLPEQPIHVRNPGGPHNFQLLDTASFMRDLGDGRKAGFCVLPCQGL